MDLGLNRISRKISTEIEIELQRIGLLFRIFGRAKSEESIERKLVRKRYDNNIEGKKMQDIIGIRVVLYFKDDLPLVHKALKSKFPYLDETIDESEETVFAPNRLNLIFRLSNSDSEEVEEIAVKKYRYIDKTYEVQLRTMLSEGWHEIEHDLRYKCHEDWENQQEMSRTMNGLYASLETNDWSILSLFDQLSYEHYKARNVAAMLRHKFRIRLSNELINAELLEIIHGSQSNLLKKIYRTDRKEFLNKIFDDGVKFPLTMSNLIFVLNGYYFNDMNILKLTPDFLLDKNEIFG